MKIILNYFWAVIFESGWISEKSLVTLKKNANTLSNANAGIKSFTLWIKNSSQSAGMGCNLIDVVEIA